MIKKTITYTDPDGIEQSEDHYFNITVQQIVEDSLDAEAVEEGEQKPDSVFQRIQNFDAEKMKGRDIMQLFKDVISLAYGIRSEDGKRFIKSDEITSDFLSSFAYDELYGQLLTNTELAIEFITGLFPKKVLDQVSAQMDGKSISEIARERSEANLQGYKKPQTAEKEVETVPDIEPLQLQEGQTETEDEKKARLRADLEAQLAELK